VYLIDKVGTNVNLGNIAHSDLVPLETLRLGLRGDTLMMMEDRNRA
jgi:phosphosulfolactate synthase